MVAACGWATHCKVQHVVVSIQHEVGLDRMVQPGQGAPQLEQQVDVPGQLWQRGAARQQVRIKAGHGSLQRHPAWWLLWLLPDPNWQHTAGVHNQEAQHQQCPRTLARLVAELVMMRVKPGLVGTMNTSRNGRALKQGCSQAGR